MHLRYVRVGERLHAQVLVSLMLRYIVSELRNNRSVKPLGLDVCLWVMSGCGRVLFSKVAANWNEYIAYKLRTVVREREIWDPKRNYAMVKEQVCCMRRIFFRRRRSSYEPQVVMGQKQDVQTTLCVFWRGQKVPISTKSDGLKAGSDCTGRLRRHWLPFQGRFVQCATIVYTSLALFG